MPMRRYIINQISICIICEGSEEYDYLNRLKQLGVWNSQYRIDLVDAQGNGNLPARYQDKYQNDMYEIVLVFCDTEKKPYEQYIEIKNRIDHFHGIAGISDRIVFFGNPCTMQIIIEHFADVKLKTAAKKINAEVIEKYTGITNYKAKQEQRTELMSLIDEINYHIMVKRVGKLSNDDKIPNSSNFDSLMKNLENEDSSWIDDINDLF